MHLTPPRQFVDFVQATVCQVLEENPAASSSESFVQHLVEFALLAEPVEPRYFLRIGINYHGQKVQHVQLDQQDRLIGWNPAGDSLGTGSRAMMLLSGHTIFPRLPDEHLMTDSKVGGGEIPEGRFVRIEFKVRGWLGKTKNLDGAQLEKDIDLMKDGFADLLVVCLSETAHRKWRGEGPVHQAGRRSGTQRFINLLPDVADVPAQGALVRELTFEGQEWASSTERAIGLASSIMPGALHLVSLFWRR